MRSRAVCIALGIDPDQERREWEEQQARDRQARQAADRLYQEAGVRVDPRLLEIYGAS